MPMDPRPRTPAGDSHQPPEPPTPALGRRQHAGTVRTRWRLVVVSTVIAVALVAAAIIVRSELVPASNTASHKPGLITGAQPAPAGSGQPRGSGAGVQPGSKTSPSQRAGCELDAQLVPGCGVLWGVAPGQFTGIPGMAALHRWEADSGRSATIYHAYHRGDEHFPTAAEIAIADEPAHHRLLLMNWKVDWGTTWHNVAAGGEDGRIDSEAAYLKAHFTEKFLLAIHHEPENDVIESASSGMTASDYAAMFRHTVLRLRQDGVNNAVFVLAYMGYEQWCLQPWFGDLWPGSDVVDWIGYDPYETARPGAYAYGDFAKLVNGTHQPSRWPGFYTWATTTHPGKPLMLAEWGIFEYTSDPTRKAWIDSTVTTELPRFPDLKALVYFDSPNAPKGDTRINSSPLALASFRRLAAMPAFNVTVS